MEALIGAYLLQHVVRFHNALDRVKDVVALVLLAAVLSPLASATLGVVSLGLSGAAAWADFGGIWLGWWLGDAMGAVIVAPVLLTGALRPWRHWTRTQRLEALVLFAGLAGVTYVAFVASGTWAEAGWPLASVIYPFSIWAALRFGPPGAAASVLLSSAVAVVGTIGNVGPFAGSTPFDTLLQLLTFMAVLALTALILAAVIAERNQAQGGLRALNEDLERRIHERTAALESEVEERANAQTALQASLARAEVLHAVKGGPGLSHVADVAFEELMDGLSGWVLRNNRPALSPKGAPDPRESLAVQQRRAETDCGAIIVAPLRYRDQRVGTMTAINRPDGRDFTREDVELMMTMANQAAVAIENARLVESLRELQVR